eukprot:5848896-Amphidinium_carterae.1
MVRTELAPTQRSLELLRRQPRFAAVLDAFHLGILIEIPAFVDPQSLRTTAAVLMKLEHVDAMHRRFKGILAYARRIENSRLEANATYRQIAGRWSWHDTGLILTGLQGLLFLVFSQQARGGWRRSDHDLLVHPWFGQNGSPGSLPC